MSIILDTRERELIGILKDHPVKPLPVGDVWIGVSTEGESNGIVMERKTVADLEASLTDGRYREQRTRLLAFCNSNKARAVYCIEGSLDRLGGKKTQQELWQILNRLMFRYGVFVFQTESVSETAKYIETLSAQITKDSTVFVGEQLYYSDVTNFTKRGNKEDPKNFATAVLQQCPGVSIAVARSLMEKYKTLTAIIAAEPADLQTTKVGARSMGPVVAKRLWSLFHAE